MKFSSNQVSNIELSGVSTSFTPVDKKKQYTIIPLKAAEHYLHDHEVERNILFPNWYFPYCLFRQH